MKKYIKYLGVSFLLVLFSCQDNDDNSTLQEPKLIFKFKLDPTQVRLNNVGQPAAMPTGHAGQDPVFNLISSHYLELAQTDLTALGNGTILYRAPETTIGGALAIDFSQSKNVAENETFFEIPISQVTPGTYKWVRCSLAYQNYQIKVLYQNVEYSGTLASFVGFNTYINSFNIGNNIFNINGNRPQGFWAFALNDMPYSTMGQSTGTTVPNPNPINSPIPLNSCVVTGSFASPLTITGTEKSDVVVTLSLSINKSFEWTEVNADGKFEPTAGEQVVDMGLRGLIPSYVK